VLPGTYLLGVLPCCRWSSPSIGSPRSAGVSASSTVTKQLHRRSRSLILGAAMAVLTVPLTLTAYADLRARADDRPLCTRQLAQELDIATYPRAGAAAASRHFSPTGSTGRSQSRDNAVGATVVDGGADAAPVTRS
jgi:hypothetical protein